MTNAVNAGVCVAAATEGLVGLLGPDAPGVDGSVHPGPPNRVAKLVKGLDLPG